MKYKDQFNSLKACLVHYASLKADIIKGKADSAGREAWDAVPVVSADSKWGDIVKDYSIDPRHGHVGVVSRPAEHIKKRDGREAVRIEMEFINHTTVSHYADVKTRKIEFILNNNQ